MYNGRYNAVTVPVHVYRCWYGLAGGQSNCVQGDSNGSLRTASPSNSHQPGQISDFMWLPTEQMPLSKLVVGADVKQGCGEVVGHYN